MLKTERLVKTRAGPSTETSSTMPRPPSVRSSTVPPGPADFTERTTPAAPMRRDQDTPAPSGRTSTTTGRSTPLSRGSGARNGMASSAKTPPMAERSNRIVAA